MCAEQKTSQCAEPAVLKKLIDLYIDHRRKYVLCLPTGRIITPKYKDGHSSWLSDSVLKQHLQHKYAVGVFAGTRGSKFLCFDVDDGSKDTVRIVQEQLNEIGVAGDRIYVSTSGGKGYHVELFFDRPVRTSLLRLLYEKVIGGGNLNPHQVEFRPTAGSAIKLPLSIHAKTGNVCWYVDRRTLEPIEDDRYILTIKQMKASWIEEALADMEPEACADSEAETACPDSTVLIAPGTRHIQMRNIAVYMRQHGADEPSIRRELTTWYEKQPPDTIRSARDVVMEDIEELVAWVFSENFCMSYQPDPRKVKLSAADMRRVLRVGSRSVRRIYFLIMVRCYAGQAEISLEEIAEATGISRKTVTQALRKMREMHCVECRPGIRKKLSDGRFVCEKNRYRIPPAPAEAVQYAVPVDAVSMMSSFEDCYHQALHTLLSRSEAYELLTEEEAADYDAYAAKHRKQEIEKLPFLDLQGTPVSYSHDGYGEITAFASEGQVWFPARACARIQGYPVGQMALVYRHCPNRRKWRTTARPNAAVYFIPTQDLQMLVEKSVAQNKNEIAKWILGGE